MLGIKKYACIVILLAFSHFAFSQEKGVAVSLDTIYTVGDSAVVEVLTPKEKTRNGVILFESRYSYGLQIAREKKDFDKHFYKLVVDKASTDIAIIKIQECSINGDLLLQASPYYMHVARWGMSACKIYGDSKHNENEKEARYFIDYRSYTRHPFFSIMRPPSLGFKETDSHECYTVLPYYGYRYEKHNDIATENIRITATGFGTVDEYWPSYRRKYRTFTSSQANDIIDNWRKTIVFYTEDQVWKEEADWVWSSMERKSYYHGDVLFRCRRIDVDDAREWEWPLEEPVERKEVIRSIDMSPLQMKADKIYTIGNSARFEVVRPRKHIIGGPPTPMGRAPRMPTRPEDYTSGTLKIEVVAKEYPTRDILRIIMRVDEEKKDEDDDEKLLVYYHQYYINCDVRKNSARLYVENINREPIDYRDCPIFYVRMPGVGMNHNKEPVGCRATGEVAIFNSALKDNSSKGELEVIVRSYIISLDESPSDDISPTEYQMIENAPDCLTMTNVEHGSIWKKTEEKQIWDNPDDWVFSSMERYINYGGKLVFSFRCKRIEDMPEPIK